MFNNNMSRILLTGSLLIRFSMLIITAGLLVVTLASPASASAAIVTTGQVPASDDQIASRQEHSIWLAAKQEAKMQATVEYLVSVNGSTATLESIPKDYRAPQIGFPLFRHRKGLTKCSGISAQSPDHSVKRPVSKWKPRGETRVTLLKLSMLPGKPAHM